MLIGYSGRVFTIICVMRGIQIIQTDRVTLMRVGINTLTEEEKGKKMRILWFRWHQKDRPNFCSMSLLITTVPDIYLLYLQGKSFGHTYLVLVFLLVLKCSCFVNINSVYSTEQEAAPDQVGRDTVVF